MNERKKNDRGRNGRKMKRGRKGRKMKEKKGRKENKLGGGVKGKDEKKL